jgi:hypothetical protein
MSGAEFDRRDRSNDDELIPRVSKETGERILMELSEVQGTDDHLVATYLERIRKVNPIVAEYIAWVAKQIPAGPNSNHNSNYVTIAGVLVYRLLEHEFEQRGKEMPIVEMETADSLIVDLLQEERYFERYFLKLAESLRTENYELLEALSTFWLSVKGSDEKEQVSLSLLMVVSGLGVYALIKAQAGVNKLSSLWSS